MSAKRSVKARKMWANYYGNGTPVIHATLIRAREYGPHALNRQAVYVLPADATNYDAMVEQGAKKLRDHYVASLKNKRPVAEFERQAVRLILGSLGIVSPHRPAKTRK